MFITEERMETWMEQLQTTKCSGTRTRESNNRAFLEYPAAVCC